MAEIPPELRHHGSEDDDAPRRPKPIVTVVAILCLAALVLSTLSGLFL
ncbi:hypothetical protein ACL90Y_11250 [Micrococcus luteus]